jgi:hypothetical protein
MITHGRFHKQHRHRPMIIAEIFHPSIGFSRGFNFVIDTGAERTLIVPYYENMLKIPTNMLVRDIGPIDTIGGKVSLVYLPFCSMVFNDMQGKPYPVGRINVYFFAPEEKSKIMAPLIGRPDFPCILGRDILQQLSLGYCQTSDYLFVTKNTKEYRDILLKEFPRPPVDWLS